MKKGLVIFIAFLSVTAIFLACKKPAGNDTLPAAANGFDKTAMLSHYADGVIIPEYKTMQQKMDQLQAACSAFLAVPSLTTQAAAKVAYMEAHLQYQRVAAFQFGPAETALLDIYLNYSGGLDYSFTTAGQLTGFSVDTATIENNITSGIYDLGSISRNSLYSQGFPALSYLLFGPDAIAKFSTNTAARVRYANDVVGRMKTLVDKVAAEWPGYRGTFIENTKTSNGSPIGNMVNQLAYQMDMLKGPRIGWPFGKQSNGIVFAAKCEGYYLGNSVSLAVANLTSLKVVYTGNASGKGLSDYIVALNRATLNDEVLAQFDVAIGKLKAIPDPLSLSLTAHPAAVDAAYKEIQKLLTLMKTDVASATAVQITFTDNDGD